MRSNTRLITFLIAVVFIAVVGLGASYIARGYRFDQKNGTFKPTGLLVATSTPNGASILVNGTLESATNATISLPPDTYDVQIKKEGYLTWSKRLTIKKEEVTKVDVTLFPAAPSLAPITFNGAIKPLLSPDGTKVAFGIPKQSNSDFTKVGIYIMDLGSLPIGFSSEPKQVTNLNPETSNWYWAADSRELLVTTSNGVFLLPSGSTTLDSQLTNISGLKLDKAITEWQTEKQKKQQSVIASLPQALQDVFNRKARAVSIAPDENKILYVASGSAQIAEGQIPSIPGSSTQPQERTLKDSQTYVYDIKEDRNFLITDQRISLADENTIPATSSAIIKNPVRPVTQTAGWFPNSNQIILTESNRVTIMDSDGTNRQIVWSGPYELPYIFAFPTGNRLLMLTTLGAGTGTFPNLYSISLK
jgi:hypothetical protein